MRASLSTAPSRAHDRVAAGERGTRRKRLQADARAVECRAATLDEEPRGGDEPLAIRDRAGLDRARARASRRAPTRWRRALETGAQLVEVGHHQARGRGRSCGANVRGEVAEWLVLLVSNRGDDRNGARRNGAHDPLVAEREQVLEASSSAREDHHVDAVAGGETDNARTIESAAVGPWTRVSATTRRTAGYRVVIAATTSPRAAASTPVSRPTAAREARQASLPLRREQTFGLERAPQPAERGSVVAGADPLHHRDSEAQLSTGLVQLEPAHRLDALPFGERRRERVIAAPRHRRGQARAALGVLQRQEHRCPGGAALELRDLAFHPDVADARDVSGEPPVERGDRVDLALDLAPPRRSVDEGRPGDGLGLRGALRFDPARGMFLRCRRLSHSTACGRPIGAEEGP